VIPKVIHYCWFGRGSMPGLALKCIDSWKQFLPDYELKLWNEDNFDVNSFRYTKEAYENKKYAFVTDVVRLKALKDIGGIYMDTDVEVLKSFDDLLYLPAFSGFECLNFVPTGIMASQKEGKWATEQFKYYDNRPFVQEDGSFDQTTNTTIISNYMKERGFALDNSYQVFDDMHFFPNDYFSPLVWGKINKTENTYCIHHFAGSWNPRARRLKRWFFRKIIGGDLTVKLVLTKRALLAKISGK